MTTRPRRASWRAATVGLAVLALVAAACGDDDTGTSEPAATAAGTDAGPDPATTDSGTDAETTDSVSSDSVTTATDAVFRIGAIPDQEPERLQRMYGLLADELEESLGVDVEYVPVTDYQGAVTAFRVGDLDAVWFGGLTGVQARLEVEGASAVAQRDIDEVFTSVFIANTDSGLEPIDDVDGLAELAGHSFTFGSESSTSGRLMPQAFLTEAGIDVDSDFDGPPGFSGSHDATIEVVSAGTYESGALNSQVWDDRLSEGVVDTDRVIEIYRTPTYFDYHWVVQADLDERFGDGFEQTFVDALVALDASDPVDAEVLDLFGAGAFIPTANENYDTIEAVARDAGLIR